MKYYSFLIKFKSIFNSINQRKEENTYHFSIWASRLGNQFVVKIILVVDVEDIWRPGSNSVTLHFLVFEVHFIVLTVSIYQKWKQSTFSTIKEQ